MVSLRTFWLAALILAFSCAHSATTYAEDQTLPTKRTARTLAQNEWSIGIFRADYGITDSIDIGLAHLYYAVPLFNLSGKYQIWAQGQHAVSMEAGFYYAKSETFWWYDGDNSSFWAGIIPADFIATIGLTDNIYLSPSIGVNLAIGEGTVDAEQTQGIAAATQMIVGVNAEWVLTPRILLGTKLRFSPIGRVRGSGSAVVKLDDRTVADVKAAGSADPNAVNNAFSAVGYFLFSWDVLHIRAGGGWGSLTVPGLNLMSVNHYPLIDFDVYVRF